MRTISTGQPSTVDTYYGISKFFGDKAEAFMKSYMDSDGPDAEIIGEESQMLYLLARIGDMEIGEIQKIKLFSDGNEDLFTI